MINIGYKKTPLEKSQKSEIMDDIKKSIDDSDMILISKLNNLRNTLNNDQLNIKSVNQQIKDIAKYDQVQNFDYLSNMLKPEKARGSKVPSQIPIPSCSFQLHNSIALKTNASGNLAFIMNPFFLADKSVLGTLIDGPDNHVYVTKFLSSAWVNNDDSLTGAAANDKWVPVDFGQVIPSVYNQYRLVSASLVVKYIGRLDTVQGMIGGAIIYNNAITFGGKVYDSQSAEGDYDPDNAGANTIIPELSKYGNFDLAQDSFYHSENMTLEGVRELYFPIDNSYEEYVNVISKNSGIAAGEPEDDKFEFMGTKEILRGGFQWFFYATNAPPNTSCFRFDIYCNFECLPNAEFLNYMPISLSVMPVSDEEKKRAILLLQSKPVMKQAENTYDNAAPPNIFKKMIRKFDNGLPGFDKLRSWGLINAVPGLKSGLALAGNMITSNMMIDDYD